MGIRGGGDSRSIRISSEYCIVRFASASLLCSLKSLCSLLGGIWQVKMSQEEVKRGKEGVKGKVLKACCVAMVFNPTLGFSPVPFCTVARPSAVFLGASDLYINRPKTREKEKQGVKGRAYSRLVSRRESLQQRQRRVQGCVWHSRSFLLLP